MGGYLILVAVFFFSFLFTLTPILFQSLGLDWLAEANYRAFQPFCHQLSHRSLHVWGFKLAVCARCSGVYLGFLAGALIYPVFRPLESEKMVPLWFIALSFTPLVLDGFTQLLGFRESNNLLRLATGLLFGVGASSILVVVVARMFREDEVDINR